MNTAAAAEAGVTVATIRTWCRRNVISAAKAAGRWVIDTASLARRTRKETSMIDLNVSYSWTSPGDTEPTTVTPKIRDRQRTTGRVTTVTNLARAGRS